MLFTVETGCTFTLLYIYQLHCVDPFFSSPFGSNFHTFKVKTPIFSHYCCMSESKSLSYDAGFTCFVIGIFSSFIVVVWNLQQQRHPICRVMAKP